MRSQAGMLQRLIEKQSCSPLQLEGGSGSSSITAPALTEALGNTQATRGEAERQKAKRKEMGTNSNND